MKRFEKFTGQELATMISALEIHSDDLRRNYRGKDYEELAKRYAALCFEANQELEARAKPAPAAAEGKRGRGRPPATILCDCCNEVKPKKDARQVEDPIYVEEYLWHCADCSR